MAAGPLALGDGHGTWELAFAPAAASLQSSGFVLEDSLRAYLAGVGLDLLAALLLVWATAGLRRLPLRLSLASTCLVGLHVFGGWQREPQLRFGQFLGEVSEQFRHVRA